MKTEDKELLKINNGDIFDIGQTVNGVSKFILFNGRWYYFEERMSREYEYDQADLSKCIYNRSGLEEITFIGNVFDLIGKGLAQPIETPSNSGETTKN